MFNIGPQELLLILVVALVVVGPRRLPEIGRSLGRGLREIRKAQDEVRQTIKVNLDEEPRPAFADRTPAPGSTEAAEAPEVGTSAPGLAAAAGAAGRPVAEISKTLGRGLAELRKARREIERSFRVEMADPPRGRTPGATRPAEPPTHRPAVPPDAATDGAEADPAAPPE